MDLKQKWIEVYEKRKRETQTKRHFIIWRDGTDEITAAFHVSGNNVKEIMDNFNEEGDCVCGNAEPYDCIIDQKNEPNYNGCECRDCIGCEAMHADDLYIFEYKHGHYTDNQIEKFCDDICNDFLSNCDNQAVVQLIENNAVYLPDFNWEAELDKRNLK